MVSHFNFAQWHGWLDKYYPELFGKGDRAWQLLDKPDFKSGPPRQFQCPCASNPLFEDLLAGLMEASARAGVRRLAMWTTEYWGQCECDKCRNTNQFVLETRALTNAWRRVREDHPDFELQIFYSFGKCFWDGRHCKKLAPDTGDKVSQELLHSEVVEIWHACFAHDVFSPQLAVKGKVMCSFRVPRVEASRLSSDVIRTRTFIEQLLSERWQGGMAFVSRGMRGHRLNSQSYAAFPLAAIAEWGWNNKGRNISQLAEAWATINRYDHPEKFAEFIRMTQPSVKRIWRMTFSHKSLFAKAAEGKVKWPSLSGEGNEMPGVRQALRLAEEIGQPHWVLEAKTILTYLEINSAAGDLIALIKKGDSGRVEIKQRYEAFLRAGEKMNEVLSERGKLYGRECAASNKTIRADLDSFIREVGTVVKPLI